MSDLERSADSRPVSRPASDRPVSSRPATDSSTSSMMDEMTPRSAAEAKSLDQVQRTLISLLIVVVMGCISATLAAYLVLSGEELGRTDVIGLWVMTGVIGLLCAAMVLLVNRRRPYHPLVLIGLLPMATSWYWIFH